MSKKRKHKALTSRDLSPLPWTPHDISLDIPGTWPLETAVAVAELLNDLLKTIWAIYGDQAQVDLAGNHGRPLRSLGGISRPADDVF
jgi:hypothetical protein